MFVKVVDIIAKLLEIKYKNKNIADVLNMTVDEGCDFFENIPAVRSKLLTLKKVGLGYIKIGQQATTLSGGEAQRIKLAKELSKRSTGRTMYILDEPTTGLHAHDIKKLLEILQTFVVQGNTVVVIEHNLRCNKNCWLDYWYGSRWWNKWRSNHSRRKSWKNYWNI